MSAEQPSDKAAKLRGKAETLVLTSEVSAPEKFSPEETQRILHELQVHQAELEAQNEELRRTHAALEALQAHYFDLYDLAPVGYCILSEKGMIIEANLTLAIMLGANRKEMTKTPITRFIFKEDQDLYYKCRKELFEAGALQEFELRMVKMDETVCRMHLQATVVPDVGGTRVCRLVLNDITGRRQAERRQALQAEVLTILNNPLPWNEVISRIITAIQKETGFHAVGIRLKENEDYPYFAQSGFSTDFLRTENTLMARGTDGGLCRDSQGKISLECTCGLVLSGKTDSSHSLFTPGGSFWSNETKILLEMPIDQDPRLHPRNRCIHEGFRSVALIPLRHGSQVMGLLQLNDRRPNQFTLEMIQFYEVLCMSIGIALGRRQMEEDLRFSNMLLTLQQERAIDGILMVREDGTISSFNQRFVEMWGIPQEVVKTKSDAHFLEAVRNKLTDPEEFFRKVQQLYQSQITSQDEVSLKDGRFFDRYSTPVFDAGQKYCGRIWYFRDMTETRKRKKRTLPSKPDAQSASR